jgi:polyhydroxyalkanoate synthesis regulator phasin
MNANNTPLPDPLPNPLPEHRPARGRRAVAIGLTAGLLGGGAAGLVLGVPSLTSASDSVALQQPSDETTTDTATDDTTSDDTTSDTATDDTSSDTADRVPGTRLREALQPLVDDGTITAEQADAVTAQLIENMPERGNRGHGGFGQHGGFDGDVVAGALGITTDELRTALGDGQTVAEIAAAQGVDVQVVIDAVVAAMQERLDQAVANGRLTQEEADARLAQMTERATEWINEGGSFGPGRGGRGGHRGGPFGDTNTDTDAANA